MSTPESNESVIGRLMGGYLGKTALAAAGMAVSMLLAYFFHFSMVRLLSPAEYGDLSALAALLVIATLPMMSVQGLFSREVAKLEGAGKRSDGVIRKYLKKTVGWGLAISLPLSAIALLSLGFSQLALGAAVTFFAIPFGYGCAVISGYYQGKEKILELNALLNAPVLFRVILAVMLVWAGLGVAGAAASFSLGFLLVLLLLAFAFGWAQGEEAEGAYEELKVGGSYVRILAANFLLVVFVYLDLFFVRWILGPESAGYYNAAGVMAKIPFYVSTSAVFVLLPQASKLTFSHRRELAKRLAKSALLIIPIAPVFWFASYPLLSFFFGARYADNGALAFGTLSVAMVIFGLANLLINVLWSQGREGGPLIVSIAIIPVQAALLLSFVPSRGLSGAALATLVSSSLLLAFSGASVAYRFIRKPVLR